jgi:aldehyde:ferredoxin oxidoreductase
MTLYGYGKILDVDLTTRKIEKKDLDAKFAEEFIGGMGFSCRMLYDEVGTNVDPLGPENIIIFANGPLTGTQTPCSGRTEVTTKSPLTGHIGTGNMGGHWGARLKHAGFDLLVIRGQAEEPCYLWINDDTVEIRNADHLWGKETQQTSDIFKKELGETQTSRISVLAIGQAGENLIRYACPVNDLHHVAARCGAGAVMGAKKLKGIAVHGTGSVQIARPQAFQEAVREARDRLLAADRAAKMPGAPKDIRIHDLEKGCLPGKNFQTGILPRWVETRSLAVAKQYVTGLESTCYHCPISCFNVAEVKDGRYPGTKVARGTMPGVVFSFGALCAIDNLPGIWKCKELCQRFGMDYASAGACLAFAMELFQRGIITRSDTDGLDLSWGNEESLIELLRKIAYREGFGGILAEGSQRAAKIIGRESEKYAFTTKGMEMTMMPDPRAGTRRGWLFGFLTNPRGGDNVKNTHFYAERYNPNWWVNQFDMFDEVKEKIYSMPPEKVEETWQGKAIMCKWFEDLYSICNALGFCFFTVGSRLAWGPTYISKLFSACTGRDTTPQQMMAIGEKVFTLLKVYTIREGLTRKDDAWPERFYTEPMPEGPAKGGVLSRKEIENTLDEYYELREWDKATGRPTVRKLNGLGLQDLAADLQRLGKIPNT